MSFVPDRVWFIHSIPYRHPPAGGGPLPCGSSRMVAGRNDPDEECNGHDCDDARVGKNHGNPCNGRWIRHRECHHYYKRHRTVGRTRCTPAMDNGCKNCRGRSSDTLVSLLVLWLGTRVSSNGTDGRRAVEWWGEPPPFRRTTVWFEYDDNDDDHDYYYYSAMAMMMIK